MDFRLRGFCLRDAAGSADLRPLVGEARGCGAEDGGVKDRGLGAGLCAYRELRLAGGANSAPLIL
ncbi:hypothetical protein MA16_Dca022742 [Dendrobium catenatum]|uniref:Uncharacterized protein n=1 Tax=Dendrobium catenatum TaxID=906689 RepID=A0A2I0WJ77_9ASPA|nr:hypothetical protein MA16_Dca022742 [Dendrobium catenatum]